MEKNFLGWNGLKKTCQNGVGNEKMSKMAPGKN